MHFICALANFSLSVWGWEGASIPIIQLAHPYGHLTQLIPLRIGAFSPLLIRTGQAQRERERERGLDREADPRVAHVSQGWEPVGYGLELRFCVL